ncbi:FAD-dependent oxidoreductase [Porphyrobacter sp. TH134]|uniref:FAD-dependent oxidoreductase n=1 Tax=Porphyrobacter sp. TH134 TaxID=2067450 RepID=UPI000C7BB0B0|nr:FAD-dependent oxidoreductase [Porphyrobacter sp. TH134]PLK22891.1 FAD-dependent oxidoreductase [Porphyrobacter sp. TH134]
MQSAAATPYDYVVIGGGFYGCCLALYLRSISARVLVVEAGPRLMDRASRVNQARVHTGFHYPRSAATAVKSMLLHRRFLADFPDAVVGDFQMLYAIARRRSKVTAKKFHRMFRDMGAPIEPASPSHRALFNPDMVEDVFACFEVAFDHKVLGKQVATRMADAGIEVRLETELVGLADHRSGVVVALSDGSEVTARYAFNITYAQINAVLAKGGLPQARLKHEIAELALIEPPRELEKIGVTVMDGPFFSAMPYPSEQLYSLTHVRYTPHESWADNPQARDPYRHLAAAAPETRFAFMQRDAQRYLPCLAGATYRRSIYDVKTILIKNEADDGRPILYHQKPETSRVISILGGKIDNIYDLFEAVKETAPEFASLNSGFVFGHTYA